jgi:septal ring-binding cell division protein DamX
MATTVKQGVNGALFDFSGMKEPEALIRDGYRLQASSTSGRNHVTSYIAKHKGRRVYGYYDYQKAEYIEESIN